MNLFLTDEVASTASLVVMIFIVGVHRDPSKVQEGLDRKATQEILFDMSFGRAVGEGLEKLAHNPRTRKGDQCVFAA